MTDELRRTPEPETAEERSDRIGLDRTGVAATEGGRMVETAPHARRVPHRGFLVFSALLVFVSQLLLFLVSGNWLSGLLAVLVPVAVGWRLWLDRRRSA